MNPTHLILLVSTSCCTISIKIEIYGIKHRVVVVWHPCSFSVGYRSVVGILIVGFIT